MCGGYKLTVPFREIVRLYNLTNSVNLPARYNIAPTQDVLVVVDDRETKQRRGEMMRWGLVPFWAKDTKIGYSLINAKAETVAEKPAFREAFKKRRCIIPADAFYEWKATGAKFKQPYLMILDPSDYAQWLGEEPAAAALAAMLTPYPADHPASRTFVLRGAGRYYPTRRGEPGAR